MHLTITHNPDLALLLFGIGIIGIQIEFCAPGRVAPGVIGSTLALLGSASLAGLPLNWWGLAAILTGIVLFLLEATLLSRGLLTTIGAIAVLLGTKTLADVHWITAVCVTIPLSLASGFLLSVAAAARRNKVPMSRGDILKS